MTQNAPTPQPETPRRRGGIVALVIGIVVVLLAAGTLFAVQTGLIVWPGTEQPAPVAPTATPDPPEPMADPSGFDPLGTATDNLPVFEQTLLAFAAGGEPVEGAPIVNAVTAAGFDRAAMQVSFDRTRTDLVADSIFVSVRMGEACLIGQITTADRGVSAVVEPAIGPERSICLIGQTRPIDW